MIKRLLAALAVVTTLTVPAYAETEQWWHRQLDKSTYADPSKINCEYVRPYARIGFQVVSFALSPPWAAAFFVVNQGIDQIPDANTKWALWAIQDPVSTGLAYAETKSKSASEREALCWAGLLWQGGRLVQSVAGARGRNDVHSHGRAQRPRTGTHGHRWHHHGHRHHHWHKHHKGW